MYKLVSILLLAGIIANFFACKQNPTNATPVLTGSAVKLSMEDCVKDSTCAKVSIEYPVFSGPIKPDILESINKSIAKSAVMSFEEPGITAPTPAAFDTMAKQLFTLLKSDGRTIPGMSYYYESKSKEVFLSQKYLSIESTCAYFTGGAHGMYGTELKTYDLQTGKVIPLLEVVKDTVALLPLLEAAFTTAKKVDGEVFKLEEVLYTENKHLPMTNNFCITREGLRFNYLPYEVTAYAFGDTDLVITWEQLAKLAEASKWID